MFFQNRSPIRESMSVRICEFLGRQQASHHQHADKLQGTASRKTREHEGTGHGDDHSTQTTDD